MADDVILLLQKCLAEDREAWNAFFKDYARMAVNILCAKFPGLSGDDRDDVIQKVFERLYRGGLKNFRGASKYEFWAYFKTIVINTANSHHSAIARKKEAPLAEDEQASPENPHDDAEAIWQILGTIPLEDRRLILLKNDGHKDREVAGILNIPLGTVASRYSRIKEKIRKELDG